MPRLYAQSAGAWFPATYDAATDRYILHICTAPMFGVLISPTSWRRRLAAGTAKEIPANGYAR